MYLQGLGDLRYNDSLWKDVKMSLLLEESHWSQDGPDTKFTPEVTLVSSFGLFVKNQVV